MKFDPKIHHRKSVRLPGFDYSQPGAYFITVNTYQRQECFGEILDGKLILNGLGQVAKKQWERIPQRFPHIELGEFVVMPDHLHGIIIIIDPCRGIVEGLNNPDAESPRRAPTEQFGKPVPGSIGTIIRSYKSAVTLRANLIRRSEGHPV